MKRERTSAALISVAFLFGMVMAAATSAWEENPDEGFAENSAGKRAGPTVSVASRPGQTVESSLVR